jgi:hypothetical protein
MEMTVTDQPQAEKVGLLPLADSDALRAHLDRLNESGLDYRAAGMDANGTPFFITLLGPYAEAEHVITASPWDGEVSLGRPSWCDECDAHSPLHITDLAYPVHVVIPHGPTCGLPARHDMEDGHKISAGYYGPLCGAALFPPEPCPTCGDQNCEIEHHGPDCGCAGCHLQYRSTPAEPPE